MGFVEHSIFFVTMQKLWKSVWKSYHHVRLCNVLFFMDRSVCIRCIHG